MVLAVPSPANGVAGVDIAAAFWNAQVRDAVTFLLNPPHCVMYQTVAQSSIPTSTYTAILFDTNLVDSYSGHSTVTNTSRYTAQVAGWYDVIGAVWWASNATGARYAAWYINGAQGPAVTTNASPGTGTAVGTPAGGTEIFLNVGDFVELRGFQSSGGNLATSAGASVGPFARIRWVHT